MHSSLVRQKECPFPLSKFEFILVGGKSLPRFDLYMKKLQASSKYTGKIQNLSNERKVLWIKEFNVSINVFQLVEDDKEFAHRFLHPKASFSFKLKFVNSHLSLKVLSSERWLRLANKICTFRLFDPRVQTKSKGSPRLNQLLIKKTC